MIISVPGEYYVFETSEVPSRESLSAFFQDLNENDILEVRIRPENGDCQIFHVTRFYLEHQLEFTNLALPKGSDTFWLASRVCPYYAVLPVLDPDGNCVSILKKIWTYYEHPYQYEGGLDLSFLNRYERIVLVSLNEYSVELYRRVLPHWYGKRLCLVGEEWNDYLDVLPPLSHVPVTVYGQLDEIGRSFREEDYVRLLYIADNLPENEGIARYEHGIMSYDEVMTLTFLFSHVTHPGTRYPDRRFFLIDGRFNVEGIFGIWNKVFTAARYALSKGYTPAFAITSSDDNLYCDHPGDDIWDKFFLQPEGFTLSDIRESCYLAHSPNMNILTIMRHIMNENSENRKLSWPDGIFNAHVRQYLADRQQRFLPHPQRTLGVLIRGTDYIHNPLPNHPRQASLEMVMEKISEIEASWDFDWIYLSTEDQNICERMKERYQKRLLFTDQERYQVRPGQLLADLHRTKEEGKGFRLGAEYLCSIRLLSQCRSLIASGECGALTEALRENDGKYEHVFVFHLSSS